MNESNSHGGIIRKSPVFEIVKPRQSALFFPTSKARQELPIHLAAYGGHIDVVKWTVECGVRIDGRNRKGSNALDIAIEKGNIEVINLPQNIGSNMSANKYCKNLKTSVYS